MSNLWSLQGTDDLENELTGVTRAYRRRGIALALKLRTIAYAKAHGCPVIRTWNASTNGVILSINDRLGFVRQPAAIHFVKIFKAESH
jgi:GNAT superfamily N-acetyltransferase